MPELPEVEAVRLGVESLFAHRRIAMVHVFDERSVSRHNGGAEDFTRTLTGLELGEPDRRGKFLWLPLHGDLTTSAALLAHLGMSGQLLAHDLAADAPPLRHERVRLTFADTASPQTLSFHDQRLFGSLAVDPLIDDPFAASSGAAKSRRQVPTQAGHIAPDPLEPAFDADDAARAIRSHRSAVKRVLLDQTVISGIGNIYADESLWAARVHPEQSADTLSQRRARSLVDAVVAVLRRAVAVGGTSFDDQYRHVNGESGYFAIELNAYGRQGQPCRRCGGPIRRVSFMNRSSHFCPRCQRRR